MAVGDGVVWNEADPQNNTLANLIDDYNRDLRVGTRSRLDREHVWPSSQTATDQGGHHRYITFQTQTAAPALVGTSAGALWVGTDKALYFTNSTGTNIMLVSTAFSMAAISGGTQGSIAICSSANPTSIIPLTGSTDGLVLITHSNTAAPSWGTVSSAAIASMFGTWADKSSSYGAQEATTDGLVLVTLLHNTSDNNLKLGSCYTDANSNPTTLVAYAAVGYNGNPAYREQYDSAMFPVKKGNYWKITFNETSNVTITVYWIPMGA